MPDAQKTPQKGGIWTKLFQIQKAFKTFAITDDSDKKDPNGKPTYRYTPGWKIVEDIRSEMDKHELMLVPDITLESNDLIEYPVYKMLNGTPLCFNKKEVHIVINASFTWIDVSTGEQAGPYRIVASGANGTDKSTASALALAERYFLLKFFHVSTRDKDDEPDAHDEGNIPGVPKNQQPPAATPQQAASAAPVQGMAYRSAPIPSQAQAPYQAAPQGQGPASRNPYPTPPAYGQPAATTTGTFDPSHPAVAGAIGRLCHFKKGTVNHQTCLNEVVGELSRNGFNCFQDNFMNNLIEGGEAIREGRAPAYV